MIHSYVIGRGNTATAYLQAGMIRPVPDATADAVVDVQVQRTGGESRLKDEEVVLFFLAEKRAERTCGEEKMATPGWTEKKRSSAPMRRGSVPQKIYWEGINLNKISKKIVSLVTMAAFVLTLVPAAAFGATENTVTVVGEENQTVVLADTAKTASVDFNIKVGDTNLGGQNDYGKIAFYVTDEDNTLLTATDSGVSVKLDDDHVADLFDDNADTSANTWTPTWWIINAGAGEELQLTATFSKVGTYKIYAGTYTTEDNKVTDIGEVVATITVNDTSASATDSRLLIDGSTATVTVTEDVAETFSFNVRNSVPAEIATELAKVGQEVYVWAEDKTGEIVEDAVFSQVTDAGGNPVCDLDVNDNGNGIWTVTGAVNNTDVLAVALPNVGDGYSIHAGVAENAPSVTVNHRVTGITQEVAPITVNVVAPTFETEVITFDADQADGDVDGPTVNTWTGSQTTNWRYEIDDNVGPNDVKTYTVTGVAYEDWSENVPAENEELTISTSADDITLLDTTVETNNRGEFSFRFTMDDPGAYDITIAQLEDNVKATLTVVHPTVVPADIETTFDGGVLLAGNDINYIENPISDLSDAVQFAITDVYGHAQSGNDVLAGEAAHDVTATNPTHGDYIKVNGPEGSTLDASDLILDWDPGANAYTLTYVGTTPSSDFVVGDYTVEVSLNNAKKAVAEFSVANFGEIEELTLDLSATERYDDNAQNNAITELDDQVALGQHVIVEPMYVDANGLKVKADNVSLTAEGAAIESRHLTGADRYFDLFWNIPSNQSLIGTTISVQAYDETNHNYVERELTVVSAYLDETLAFDPVQGTVGDANTVNVSVVDQDGNLSKVNGTLSAYIASQSNEDATIDLDVEEDVVNGQGKLFLQSDAEGTVDVVVAVTATNGEIYANTLTYTFGDEDPYAGSYIVMTIGSDQYLINGEMFDGSVDNPGAPYVDSAWRTMVPVRVLAESFGANVDYADNVVTIVDGDTTVVMNIGEETYTVNGEEKAMDTAAVIGDDDRTYVPVRFVAEALGYSVTPLYDANGLTSSVHFSK